MIDKREELLAEQKALYEKLEEVKNSISSTKESMETIFAEIQESDNTLYQFMKVPNSSSTVAAKFIKDEKLIEISRDLSYSDPVGRISINVSSLL